MWKCKRCGKAVYFAERKTSLGYDWHPECLRCEECGKRLNPGQHSEHKGEPYCHIPCYSLLFGPTLFGHGSQVESHTSFGRMGPKASHNVQQSHLEAKLKIYNQHQEGKSSSIQSKERNGRLILEGSLKIYWEINQVIRLKEEHDDRMPVRRRNSCRVRSDISPKVLSFPKRGSHLTGSKNEDAFNQLIDSSRDNDGEYRVTDRLYNTLPLPVKNINLETTKPVHELEADKENDEETVTLTGELSEVALRKHAGRKRSAKLRRRCSINGHYYNRETSAFTPSHGIMTSIWITSMVTPSEVINMLLDKFKVKNKAEDFCLTVVHDTGEQRLIQDTEYPLLVRVLLGPNEDVAKVFLMEKKRSLDISNEVAQFINLTDVELQTFLNKYDEEEDREEAKIRQKHVLGGTDQKTRCSLEINISIDFLPTGACHIPQAISTSSKFYLELLTMDRQMKTDVSRLQPKDRFLGMKVYINSRLKTLEAFKRSMSNETKETSLKTTKSLDYVENFVRDSESNSSSQDDLNVKV